MNKLIVLLLLFIPIYSFSQTDEIEELRQVIDSKDHDTIRIIAMCDLAWEMAQRDGTEAKVHIDNAYKLSKEINYTYGIATALHNYGNLYDLTGKYNMALDYLDQALALRIEIKDSLGQAMTYNSIGVIYDARGEFETALPFYIKSLKISDQINDIQGVAYAQNNIAVMYKFLDQPKLALEYYDNSLETFLLIDDKHAIAATYSNIGIIQKMMGDYEIAEENQKKSISLFEEIGDIQGSLVSLNSLGSLYTEMDRNPEAKKIFQEGLDKSIQMSDKEGIAISLANLGDVSVNLQEYQQAFSFYDRAIKISEELQLRNLLEHIYNSMARVSAEIGHFKDAYHYLDLHKTIKDSMLNEESVRVLTEMETKYQSEKKEMQINMLQQDQVIDSLEIVKKEAEAAKSQAEKEEAAASRDMYLIGLALMVVILILVFIGLMQNKRKSKQLSEQNKLINSKNQQISSAFVEIQEKNKDIMDSIKYAKRIQTAILPPRKLVKEYLSQSFILYKPKDIVAGDFYWLEHREGKVLFAACDCTGHGVPGAMVSVICNNGLNRSVREYGLSDPGEILDKTRNIVIAEFEKSEEEVKDGMDVAICSLEGNKLQYAGANNPLWIIRKGSTDVEEIKADKQPIGKFVEPLPYTTQFIELQTGDSIYIFSDGYADQFGGEKGKKFKATNFKKLLLSIQSESMERQHDLINESFEKWKGTFEQLDDVCVIGVRL